jgi:hypothetical protein
MEGFQWVDGSFLEHIEVLDRATKRDRRGYPALTR